MSIEISFELSSLPVALIDSVNTLGGLQAVDGNVPARAGESQETIRDLVVSITNEAASYARSLGQENYADALEKDFRDWIAAGLSVAPDFSRSRDALRPPENNVPFFFVGPLRLANAGRRGWRFECFLALREEPTSPAYLHFYRRFPHPKYVCQASHLLSGSQGLTVGNNMVFFPENIQARTPLQGQAYAVFFFNKFHAIFNKITIARVLKATDSYVLANPTGHSPRETYLARCVWGYLHDYFHHQGARPFDEHIGLKTRWFTGLLEEIKVDLETFLVCHEGDYVEAVAAAEFILLERAFRYPCEPDWVRNFDSGTGLLLLSMLEDAGGLEVTSDGRIRIDVSTIPAIARNFVARIRDIEALPDAEYLEQARLLVRQYLPEGDNGERIGIPVALRQSTMADLVGSTTEALKFTTGSLRSSMCS